MERKIFIFILYFIQTLRCLFGPLLILISFPFSYKVRHRLNFEGKNFLTDLDPQRERAFAAFEVSSEGEFEQVRPLIDYLLKTNQIVEVIYASGSLEPKMLSLNKKHKGFRSFRLPVLSFSPFTNSFLLSQNISWFLTAPRLIMCRYDFYPELLLYGLKKDVHFALVSATLKNKESPSLFLKEVFKCFDSVLCATSKDQALIKELVSKEASLATYEFRVLQIMERIKERQDKLKRLGEIIDWISEVKREQRIVFGSVWARETEVFLDPEFCKKISEGQLKVVLLPHQMDPAIEASIKGVKTYVYKDGEDQACFIDKVNKAPGVVILEVRGLLCELYSLFGHSFIGGGHGRSVHSVLEPYFSGCHIYCGPKTHRSTEIDFILENSPEDLSIVENLESFFRAFKKVGPLDKTEIRHKLGSGLYSDFENKVSLILGKKKDD